MKITKWQKLVVALLITQLSGGIGALFTTPKIQSWYIGLEKPFFSPPNWIFGPVWTLIFILMGISLWLVWNKKENLTDEIFKWFWIQLGLNILWSVIFFGLEQPGLALVEIIVLWWAIWKTRENFSRINKLSGRLFIPYLSWVSFATLLNGAIWWINR